ncbi:MAG: YcaO-like family protein [Chloroflexi bacterium]|nr:YcaO-like family protein [Chloroflexota bacterium]
MVGARLSYRGRTLEQAKEFLPGAHRGCAPKDTLDRIQPHFGAIGITRLANITHLDRVGIPVVLSIRPAGLYLGADAGKGGDLTAAKTSAAMESIERWRAETGDFVSFRCRYAELASRCAAIPESRLPLTRFRTIAPDWAYRWTTGWDLVNQEEVAVPTLRVELPSEDRVAQDLGLVVWDSTGLASGSTFVEAVHSALLETIERDAVTCVQWAAQTAGYVAPRLDLSTVDDPAACELIEAFRRAGIDVSVIDCTGDAGVVTYLAIILDRVEPSVGAFGGQGAHTDPGVALCRALTEAAQSRLVFIAGSRDDIFKRDQLRTTRRGRAFLETLFDETRRSISFGDASRLSTPSFQDDIQALLIRLRKIGIEQAIVCDLSDVRIPVSIARVIVPGLEQYMNSFFHAGERAMAFARRVGR